MVLLDQAVEKNVQEQGLVCYKTLPVWNKADLPQAFRICHNTRSGVWAKLKIFSGSLVMELMDEDKRVVQNCHYSAKNQPGLISPRQYHRIASCSDDMTCQLSFYSKNPDRNRTDH